MPGRIVSLLGSSTIPTIPGFWVCDECWALCRQEDAFRHEQWHVNLSTAVHDFDSRPVVIERPRDDLALRREIDGLYILLGEDPPFNDPEPTRAV